MAGNPGDPVDFVPAACEALAISSCIVSKDCQLQDLDTPTFESSGSFGADVSDLTELYAQVKNLDLCIIAAVQQAFLLAGCEFPEVPIPPDPPDLSACLDTMDQFAENLNQPLGPAEGIINITFDPEGRPIRIQA